MNREGLIAAFLDRHGYGTARPSRWRRMPAFGATSG